MLIQRNITTEGAGSLCTPFSHSFHKRAGGGGGGGVMVQLFVNSFSLEGCPQH